MDNLDAAFPKVSPQEEEPDALLTEAGALVRGKVEGDQVAALKNWVTKAEQDQRIAGLDWEHLSVFNPTQMQDVTRLEQTYIVFRQALEKYEKEGGALDLFIPSQN